jgi:hypothetical protein
MVSEPCTVSPVLQTKPSAPRASTSVRPVAGSSSAAGEPGRQLTAALLAPARRATALGIVSGTQMGNDFGADGRDLALSNNATDVFLSVLQFALSDLADSEWERSLAQWVGWHDQNLVGRGTIGFDLADIAWQPADFPAQKAFLLRAIDLALTRYRWDELCYDPPHAGTYLRDYRRVVEPFRLPTGPRPDDRYGWPGPDEAETRCPRHNVHCSELGWCRVCDDCGQPG